MRRIDQIIILDSEEKYAPPSQPVLMVGIVEDEVFLSVAEVDETFSETTYTRLADIKVNVNDLLESLCLLRGDGHE